MVDVCVEDTVHFIVLRKQEGSDRGPGNPAPHSGACPH